jgi:hypothetical protein
MLLMGKNRGHTEKTDIILDANEHVGIEINI